MSGANEKAQLKGTFSKYLIGVALIVMCTLIASTVAGIANADGRNDADGVVDASFGLGGMKVGTTVAPSSGKKPTTKNIKSKLAVTGTDGANVEIRYKDGTKTTDPTLPYEISQYVDGKVPAGTEIQLVAEAKSEHGKEFNCWAIVDDDGNIITVLSYDNLLDYVMPEENVNIQAIYKEHVVAEVPKDEGVVIGQVEGRGAAKVTINEGTPVAVVVSSYEGTDSKYSVKFKNYDKKVGISEKSSNESIGYTNEQSDNGITGYVYGLDSSASSGNYTITVKTESGQTPQRISLVRYDKEGNATPMNVLIYTTNDLETVYYDSNGEEVEQPQKPYAVSFIDGREIDIKGDLDINNYSYVVVAESL